MFHPIFSSLRAGAMALAAAAASPTWAQASATVVPAYQSAFDGYRGFADQAVGAWPDANRDAAQAGGWRAHAKAGHAPAGSGAGAPGGLEAAAPASANHTRHAGHIGGGDAARPSGDPGRDIPTPGVGPGAISSGGRP